MDHIAQQQSRTPATSKSAPCAEDWTVPHKIVNWPSVSRHLCARGPEFESDLRAISQEGSRWFVEQTRTTDEATSVLGGLLSISSISDGEGSRSTSSLLRQLSTLPVQQCIESYFRTFNTLRPILDPVAFEEQIQARVLRNESGCEDGVEIVLYLLVIALGQVAYEGITGPTIGSTQRRESGFRGGCALLAPGSDVFEEALRRWYFVPPLSTVQRVQTLLLQAVYYETSARHWDFWKCTAAASATCESVIRQRAIDWATHEGEMLKRAYWTCVIDEGYYHYDLDLPQTGIFDFQDEVPLPTFTPGTGAASSVADASVDYSMSFFQFLATISLKRIIDRILDTVHKSLPPGQTYHEPPRKIILELDYQLDTWRRLLPSQLQWSDDQKSELFSASHHPKDYQIAYNADVMIAELRARFYNARFLLLSPFIYRALHHPELLTTDDAHHCRSALRSTFSWPMAVKPVKDQKRLVSHHFTWTQNAISVLCVFAMAKENEVLKAICKDHLDLDSWRSSVAVQLCWLEDLERVDGIARWGWRLLKPFFLKNLDGSGHSLEDDL